MSGIPSWAVRGARVVCVRDDWHKPDLERSGVVRVPVLREVLTVTASREDGRFAGLSFAEIPHWWSVRSFRPVITIDDDLKAHFVHLLDAPARVTEEA